MEYKMNCYKFRDYMILDGLKRLPEKSGWGGISQLVVAPSFERFSQSRPKQMEMEMSVHRTRFFLFQPKSKNKFCCQHTTGWVSYLEGIGIWHLKKVPFQQENIIVKSHKFDESSLEFKHLHNIFFRVRTWATWK